MTLTPITPILLIITFLIVFGAAKRGYKRGVIKSMVHFAVVVTSAFLGAGLAILLSELLNEPIMLLLEEFGVTEMLEDMIGAFAVILEVVVGMLATFICFVPSFVLMYVLLSITVSAILSSKAKNLKSKNEYHSEDEELYVKNSKRMGACIGVVSGLFVAVLMLSPWTGLLKCSANVVGIVSDFMEETGEAPEELEEVVNYSNDFMVTAIDVCGGKMWFNMSTLDYCYGEWTSINKEVDVISKLGINELTETMDAISTLDDESFDILQGLLNKISDSPLMRLMLTAAVNDMSKAWIDRTDFMGIERPEIGVGFINDFFDEILFILSTSTTRTVDKDLGTLLKLCAILREYEDVLAGGSFENAADAFADGDLLETLKREIRKNSRMLKLEHAIDDMLMGALAEQICDFSQFTYEEREELYTVIADMLSSSAAVPDDKRASVITDDIYAALDDYGIYAPEAMVEEVAGILISALSANGDEVTAEDIRDYFDSYLND